MASTKELLLLRLVFHSKIKHFTDLLVTHTKILQCNRRRVPRVIGRPVNKIRRHYVPTDVIQNEVSHRQRTNIAIKL